MTSASATRRPAHGLRSGGALAELVATITGADDAATSGTINAFGLGAAEKVTTGWSVRSLDPDTGRLSPLGYCS